MIVKEKFDLLKNLPNYLNVSSSSLDKYTIEDGSRKVFVMLKMAEKRFSHFSKDKIMDLVSDVKKRQKIRIVNFTDYSLPITYNKPTKEIIINLKPFGTEDITPTNPDPRNLFSALVYGVCFANMIEGKGTISDKMAAPITNYLLTVLVRLFGKEYGLLGYYQSQINVLKFLLSCYVLSSFFSHKNNEGLWRKAAASSGVNYKKFDDKLAKYDFTNIEDFIKSLSDLKVMPGINRYSFTAKILKLLTLNFLPAMEDLSRFVSLIAASSVSGATMIPGFIAKYNETEYQKILTIANKVVNS